MNIKYYKNFQFSAAERKTKLKKQQVSLDLTEINNRYKNEKEERELNELNRKNNSKK